MNGVFRMTAIARLQLGQTENSWGTVTFATTMHGMSAGVVESIAAIRRPPSIYSPAGVPAPTGIGEMTRTRCLLQISLLLRLDLPSARDDHSPSGRINFSEVHAPPEAMTGWKVDETADP